jgi:hypothetical protein
MDDQLTCNPMDPPFCFSHKVKHAWFVSGIGTKSCFTITPVSKIQFTLSVLEADLAYNIRKTALMQIAKSVSRAIYIRGYEL